MSASNKTSLISLLAALLTLLVLADAVPYSKYGRSCRDIGCRSDEVCVMAEDPCGSYTQRDSCGRYPTCQKSNSGGESCTTKLCPSGTYCKTENGRPTCVNTTPGLGYDSSGISSINSQRVNNYSPGEHSTGGSRYTNSDVPSADKINDNLNNRGPYTGPAYPPYPNNSNNNNNNNNGYPPYPSNGGVYPTINYNNNNRPAVDQYGYPLYPPVTPRQPDNTRYHSNYPQHSLPQANPGWGSTYSNSIYRRNGANAVVSSNFLLLVPLLTLAFFKT